MVAQFVQAQGAPVYLEDVTREPEEEGGEEGSPSSSGDDLFDRAVSIVARDRKASTSYLQRRLQIGYNRAATLIERMEEEGMISPASHAGKKRSSYTRIS